MNLPKVFITGASGYVGRNITKALNLAGYETVALSRNNPNIPNVEWVSFDPLKPSDIAKVDFSGAVIVNCAAATSDRGDSNSFRVNYIGATALAAAVKSGKFIHISSSSIYDLTSHSTAVEEDEFDYQRYKHFNNYSQTKSLAEFLLSNRMPHPDSPIISLRPHGVYGRDDTTLLPRLIKRVKWLKKGKKGIMSLPGRGNVEHSLTHIDNLIDAVKLSIVYEPSSPFTAFNISDSEETLLSEAITGYVRRDFPGLETLKFLGPDVSFASKLAKKFPQKFSEYEIQQVGYNRTYSIDKARRLLHFYPTPFKIL